MCEDGSVDLRGGGEVGRGRGDLGVVRPAPECPRTDEEFGTEVVVVVEELGGVVEEESVSLDGPDTVLRVGLEWAPAIACLLGSDEIHVGGGGFAGGDVLWCVLGW